MKQLFIALILIVLAVLLFFAVDPLENRAKENDKEMLLKVSREAAETTPKPPIISVRLTSKFNNSRCEAGTFAWAVYSAIDAKTGIVCTAATPITGSQNFLP